MELVGGKDNDEVLHSSMTCLGGRLLSPQKQGSVPVEAKLDGEVGELGEQVRTDDVTNFAATVSSHSDEEIFRHLLDSDVGEVIFYLVRPETINLVSMFMGKFAL